MAVQGSTTIMPTTSSFLFFTKVVQVADYEESLFAQKSLGSATSQLLGVFILLLSFCQFKCHQGSLSQVSLGVFILLLVQVSLGSLSQVPLGVLFLFVSLFISFNEQALFICNHVLNEEAIEELFCKLNFECDSLALLVSH